MGDVVMLTRGGPKMIVLKLDEWGADCLWSVDEFEQTVWVSAKCLVKPVERRRLQWFQWLTSLGLNAGAGLGTTARSALGE